MSKLRGLGDQTYRQTDIYVLHFQGDGTTIKDKPLINILAGGVQLPVPIQNIVDCTGKITGGHKKDAKFVADIFFDLMNDIDPEKKLVDLHMFDGASVCRNAKMLKFICPILSFILGADHT